MYASIYEWNRLDVWGSTGRVYCNLNTGEYAEEDTFGVLVEVSEEGIMAVAQSVGLVEVSS